MAAPTEELKGQRNYKFLDPFFFSESCSQDNIYIYSNGQEHGALLMKLSLPSHCLAIVHNLVPEICSSIILPFLPSILDLITGKKKNPILLPMNPFLFFNRKMRPSSNIDSRLL